MTLQAVGLPEQEADVYAALVSMAPPVAAVDVAASIGLSGASAERALVSLAKRGMARRLPGRAARYAAVEPEVAVGSLIRDHEERIALARAELRDLQSSYRKSAHRKHPAELIEVVEGRENIMALYRRLVASAATQMRYFSRPPYFSNSPDDDVEQARRMAEGIEFRVVYDSETLELADGLASIRRNVARGERARLTGRVPMEMMIVDDDQALIPLDVAALDSAYLIGPSSLLEALAALFESTWAHASPAYLAASTARAHRIDESSTPADRDSLVALLANGMSDKAIQRRLGLSPRTLQRRVQDMYSELGAQTRFQAGVAARDRGWVKPEEDS